VSLILSSLHQLHLTSVLLSDQSCS